MRKSGFISVIILFFILIGCTSNGLAQTGVLEGNNNPTDTVDPEPRIVLAHGKIDIVESYSDKIIIRWNGPNIRDCGSNSVLLTEDGLGGKDPLTRAFKIALTASVSGRPIRFILKSCLNDLQQAEAVQLCAKPNCEK